MTMLPRISDEFARNHNLAGDPAYAAIDTHRIAMVALAGAAAIEDGELMQAADEIQSDAAWALATTVPTTREGLAAMLDWFVELNELGWAGPGETPEALRFEANLDDAPAQSFEAALLRSCAEAAVSLSLTH